jgi:MFS family permease
MISSPRHARLGLLATLYLSQGLPFGFFTQALPVLLREQKLSLASIGLTSLLAIPWALKFLWAPLVDRHGSRRAWLVPLQLASVLTLLAISALHPDRHLQLIQLAILLVNLISSTQDIATDGFAVELLPHEERGLGNGIQVAGYRAGMILGGGGLLIAYEHLDWSKTFWLMAAILAVATIPVLLSSAAARQRTPPQTTQDDSPTVLNTLGRWVAHPTQRLWLLVLIAYKLGDALAQGMIRPFMVDVQMSMHDVGLILGVAGFSTSLIGALLGGAGVERLGRQRALLLFGLLQTLSLVVYCWPASLPVEHPSLRLAIWISALLEHFTSGMATAALFTWMMDRCDPERAASDYTLQACVVVIATGVAQALSGFVAQALGWPMHFAVSAALSLLGLVITASMLPRLTEPSAAH